MREQKQNYLRYPIVSFWIESRDMSCTKDTNELARQRLNTVFDEWIESWNVTVTEDSITGLTGPLVQRWFNEFKKTRKPSTVNNYLSFLNPFLSWAYELEFLDRDYSRILKRVRMVSKEFVPQDEQQPEKYLTHDDAKRLLEARIGGEFALRNRAVVALFLYSGIRVSELCSLTIESVRKHGRGLIYCKRKGGAWKDVEVAEPFYPYLEAYLATRTDRFNMDAPLFATNRGGFMDRKLIYLTLAPVQKELGIATGSHALRHTYISQVDKIGGPTIARDLANHASLKITNRYDHSTRDQRVDVLNKLNWAK